MDPTLPREMTAAEARAALVVYAPQIPDMRNSDGEPFDKHGNRIDDRRLVQSVDALGPFGSWPSTLGDAERDLAAHETWWLGRSFRLGWVVVYKEGWGYAANHPDHAEKCRMRTDPNWACSCGGA